jgi:hypothetical protein
MWQVHVIEYFDGGRERRSTKEHATKEKAFEYACSLRHQAVGLTIDAPDRTHFDETQIDEWCREHGL